MVEQTIQQARETLETEQAKAAEQRKQVEAYQAKPQLTQQQLRQVTLRQHPELQAQQREMAASKTAAMEAVTAREQQLEEYSKQIAETEASYASQQALQARAVQIARKLSYGGDVRKEYAEMKYNGELRRMVEDIQQGKAYEPPVKTMIATQGWSSGASPLITPEAVVTKTRLGGQDFEVYNPDTGRTEYVTNLYKLTGNTAKDIENYQNRINEYKSDLRKYELEVEKYNKQDYGGIQAETKYTLLTQQRAELEKEAERLQKGGEILSNPKYAPPAGFFPRAEYEVTRTIKEVGAGYGKGLIDIPSKALGIKMPEAQWEVSVKPVGFGLPVSLSLNLASQKEAPSQPIIAPMTPQTIPTTDSTSINKGRSSYFKYFTEPYTLPIGRKGAVGEITGENIADIGTWIYPPTARIRSGLFLGSFYERAGTAESKMVKEIGFQKAIKATPYAAWEYTKEHPLEVGAAVLMTAGALLKAKETITSLTYKKAVQEVPTPELQQAVEPFTRKRATVMLKTEEGKYILGKTQGGYYISIGGKVEPGQTVRQAALAELRQETGLSLRDITGFEYAKKIVTPEETFYVFTGTVKKGATMTAASDISKIVTISPKNVFIKGATGQTGLQPVARLSLFPFGRVRAYEAGIINYLETGKPVTWLSLPTESGKFYLGTQSRYDVPWSVQKKYLEEQQLVLAHGTTKPEILRKFYPFEKTTTIKAEATQRGMMPGLYVQPPVSATNAPGYIGLSYLGFRVPTSEYGGIQIGRQTATAYAFKEAPKFPITPTPKTYAGVEEELIISPLTKITSIGKAEKFGLGLRPVYVQPAKIVSAEKVITTAVITPSSEIYYTAISSEEILGRSIAASVKAEPSIISVPSITSKPSKPSVPSIKPILSIKSIPSKPSIASIALVPSAPSVPSITSIPSIISIPSKPYAPSRPSQPSYPSKPYAPSRPSVTEYKYPAAGKSKQLSLGKLSQAFKVAIKRRGQWKTMGGIYSKGEATAKGEKIARQTLARSFKLVPTAGMVAAVKEYKPSSKVFRAYKIQKGKKIPLKDEFIQRSKYSLGTRGEVSEIQMAKKTKGKWL